MKEKEKMPRLERQLRLYEVICRYAIAQFSNICEAFPYNKRLLQRDLVDLREAGLVSVKYSRKGKGYFVTGIPEFNEKAAPCKKAHLKRLNRLGRLMSGLENAAIIRCVPACRSGRGRGILKCCAIWGIRFFMTPLTIAFPGMRTALSWCAGL